MKNSILRIALVCLAVLCTALPASCGGHSKTTDEPADATPSPSASHPLEQESVVHQPSPPRLDVGTDGSVPQLDWND